mmetsp:Transcript_4981/g.9502  ORF Transcript_4981/g.9502 Transcript_4981/m.9502 type:complete len:222 (+) Transcript_4981:1102-1767(+)
MPLMQHAVGCPDDTLCREETEHHVEYSLYVPDDEDEDAEEKQLPANGVLVVVAGRENGHCYVDHEEVEGVQGVDVVQDERVAVNHHQPEHQEVQSPHHLPKTHETEVPLDVEEGEVAEPRHPHVARDEHADGVVHLACMEVVVHEKQKLHPTLPLFCLLSVKKTCIFWVSFHRSEGKPHVDKCYEPEDISTVGFGGVFENRAIFAKPGVQQYASELAKALH